jgi:tetratricopeptide (TPR) repeat protein
MDQSRDNCLQALRVEADYKQPAKLLYVLAITVLSEGNYMMAEKLFRESINLTLGEPDADIFFGLGTALHKQRKNSEAITNYDISIMLDPSKDYTWANKGNALADLEQYNEAIESYDNAIRLFDSANRKPEILATTWYLRGFALYNCRRYQDAIESYDKATEIDPSFAFAWTNKGSAYSELGKEYETKKDYDNSIDSYNKALNSFEIAIKLKPKDALNWYNRGLVLCSLGEIYCTDKELCDKGIEFINKAIESYDSLLTIRTIVVGFTFTNDPYVDALIDKGYAFAVLGKIYTEIKESDKKANELYNKAIESYEAAIKINQQSRRAYYHESVVLKALHRDPEAEEALARAKELGYKG